MNGLPNNGVISMSTNSLDSFPQEIKKTILYSSDIPEQNKWSRVSKSWNAEAVELLFKSKKQFYLTKAQAKECFIPHIPLIGQVEFNPLMQKNVNKLAAKPRKENLNILQKAIQSKSILVSLKILTHPQTPPADIIDPKNLDFFNFNSCEEIIDASERFVFWCKKNQAEFSSLTIFETSNEYLASFPAVLLQFMPNLTYLSLNCCYLTTFPLEICLLNQLKELKLSFNYLTSFPAEIGQLTNLKTLLACENRLGGLPSEIGQLTKLNLLNLFGNNLKTLPPEIGLLTNLYSLNLACNKLITLPIEFLKLTANLNFWEFKIIDNPNLTLSQEFYAARPFFGYCSIDRTIGYLFGKIFAGFNYYGRQKKEWEDQ